MDDYQADQLLAAVREGNRLLRGIHHLLGGILLAVSVCGLTAMLYLLDVVAARYGWWAWAANFVILGACGWYATLYTRAAEREKL